jgi:DNA-binding Lrp family transcriptional regulator
MNLTEKQKHILCAAAHRADQSIASICKTTGYQERTVQYGLRRMIEAGIIYRMEVINTGRLGFSEYIVFFSLAAKPGRERERALKLISSSDRVSLMLELGGNFEYAISICGRGAADIIKFFDNLGEQLGDVFGHKSVSLQCSYHGFGRKYLTGRRFHPVIEIIPSESSIAVDDLDHEILKGLSQRKISRTSILARELGAPYTTVIDRLARLRRQKVIVGSIYAVTPQLFGMKRFRLLLQSRSISREFREKMFRFCSSHPNIVNLVRVIGDWDYQINAEVSEAEDMPGIIQQVRAAFDQYLLQMEVLPVFEFLKGANYPFAANPCKNS